MASTSGNNTSAVIAPNSGPNQFVMPPASQYEKPEKFNGTDFNRWQQKMLFYLTTLNLVKFLREECPAQTSENATDKNTQLAIEAWKHADFLCRNYILNGLDNTLYGVYCDFKTAKELWESLDKKYKTEDAGTKKFFVGKFLDFKMTDSKTVMSQVQEMQVLLHDIEAEGMTLSESFQIAAMIEKLPPLWKDFKNYLKHKRKEMTMEDLIIRLRIEEDNRAAEKKNNVCNMEAKANIVEDSGSKNKKRKRSGSSMDKGKVSNAKRFKGNCYICGKPGHRAKDRRSKKKDTPKKMK